MHNHHCVQWRKEIAQHVCLFAFQGEDCVLCSGDSSGNCELCSSVGGQGAGRGKEGLLRDEEETHSGLEEEQMKYRWRHCKSGKEGRAIGAVVNLQ